MGWGYHLFGGVYPKGRQGVYMGGLPSGRRSVCPKELIEVHPRWCYYLVGEVCSQGSPRRYTGVVLSSGRRSVPLGES